MPRKGRPPQAIPSSISRHIITCYVQYIYIYVYKCCRGFSITGVHLKYVFERLSLHIHSPHFRITQLQIQIFMSGKTNGIVNDNMTRKFCLHYWRFLETIHQFWYSPLTIAQHLLFCLSAQPEQSTEQVVKLSMVRDVMILIWCHCCILILSPTVHNRHMWLGFLVPQSHIFQHVCISWYLANTQFSPTPYYDSEIFQWLKVQIRF